MKERTKLTKGYKKYLFLTEEAAKAAMHKLAAKHRGMKMKTTEHGSLWCCENGSMTYHLLVLSDILMLGGVEA